jgi:peptidoglycan/LPS O-acetylase OafA/YrhL
MGLFVISVAIGLVASPAHPWLALLTSPLLCEFLLGMLVALMASAVRPKPAISFAAIVLSIAVIVGSGWFFPHGDAIRVVVWGIPSAVLLAAVLWLQVECRGRIGRLLVTLGDASYSIYLLQVFALPGASFALRAIKAEQYLGVDAMIVIVWLVSCASGYIFWRLAERPITQFLQSRLKARTAPSPRPATTPISADLR